MAESRCAGPASALPSGAPSGGRSFGTRSLLGRDRPGEPLALDLASARRADRELEIGAEGLGARVLGGEGHLERGGLVVDLAVAALVDQLVNLDPGRRLDGERDGELLVHLVAVDRLE